jgi:hypothetical protein
MGVKPRARNYYQGAESPGCEDFIESADDETTRRVLATVAVVDSLRRSNHSKMI